MMQKSWANTEGLAILGALSGGSSLGESSPQGGGSFQDPRVSSPVRLDQSAFSKTFPMTTTQKKQEDDYMGNFCPDYYMANPRETFMEHSQDISYDYSSSYNPFGSKNLLSSSGSRDYSAPPASCPCSFTESEFSESDLYTSKDFSGSMSDPFGSKHLSGAQDRSRSQVTINITPGTHTTVNLGGDSYFRSPGDMTPPSFDLPGHKFSTPVKAMSQAGSSAYETAASSFGSRFPGMDPSCTMSSYGSAMSSQSAARCPPDLTMEASCPPIPPCDRTGPPNVSFLSQQTPPMMGEKSFNQSQNQSLRVKNLSASPACGAIKKVLDDMSQNESLTIQEGLRCYQNSRRQCLSKI